MQTKPKAKKTKKVQVKPNKKLNKIYEVTLFSLEFCDKKQTQQRTHTINSYFSKGYVRKILPIRGKTKHHGVVYSISLISLTLRIFIMYI